MLKILKRRLRLASPSLYTRARGKGDLDDFVETAYSGCDEILSMVPFTSSGRDSIIRCIDVT